MIINKIHKNILILGLGLSGLSLAKILKNKVRNLYCWDDSISVRKKITKTGLPIKSIENLDFRKLDYLVLSPAINHNSKEPHLAIKKAKKEKVKITTDIEFLKILKIKNKIIGVTGTNGKSTTTKFIEQSLSDCKNKVFSCGNIGIPFGEVIKKVTSKDSLVVETSSFQLDKIIDLKFDISILLNLSKDHIDWHRNIRSYHKAKLKIFKNQGKNCFSIICIDDKNCKKIATNFSNNFKSKLIKISTKEKLENGIYLTSNEKSIDIINTLNRTNIKIDRKKLGFTQAQHNFQNLLATYACFFVFKKSNESFKRSVSKLKNLEHRMEFVKKIKNIKIYNDSKATNINSSNNALKTLNNVYWILGGRKKPEGIKEVSSGLKNVRNAYTFGESKKEFNDFLKSKQINSKECSTLKVAVNMAMKDGLKEKKEINLLFSPASSSFDQFKNFEHRGKAFKSLINEIIKND